MSPPSRPAAAVSLLPLFHRDGRSRRCIGQLQAGRLRTRPTPLSKPFCRPWWTGKAPEWVNEDEEGVVGALLHAAEAAAAQASAAPLRTGADPRLARLARRQMLAGRRAPSEAIVVQRRRNHQPEEEEQQEDAGGTFHRNGRGVSSSPHSPQQDGVDKENEHGQEEEDAETIAARRQAIRARQLAVEAEAAAISEEEDEVRLPYILSCILRLCVLS